ncbi:L,D-transpeptidase family protein, partial [bacterium]|nr:L,D-transpeptidase family protein [bacterium]
MRTLRFVTLILGVLLSLIAGQIDIAGAKSGESWPDAMQNLQELLQIKILANRIRVSGEKIYVSIMVRQFYTLRNYYPAWSDENGPGAQAHHLIQAIQTADMEGLVPENYHLMKILNLWFKIRLNIKSGNHKVNLIKLAELDILLTDAFFSYARHLTYGGVNPEKFYTILYETYHEHDFPELLSKAIKTNTVTQTLQDFLPPHAGYYRLRKALQHYRDMADQVEWTEIPDVTGLQKGCRDEEAVRALRGKLRILKDLAPKPALDDPLFDEEVKQALARFQKRHGLPDGGGVDKATLKVLNRPLDRYIRTMEVNLERWRWLPRELGSKYIMVNIPAFELKVVEKRREILPMRVIVGKQNMRTPIFSNKIRYLILNPYWELPPNLVIKQKLQSIRYKSNYFSKHHIKVFKGWGKKSRVINPKTINWKKVRIRDFYEVYRLQQAPGPFNPLGRIKFMFPNAYNVYLHDTPKKLLFKKDIRTFSSGCIRIE